MTASYLLPPILGNF